MKIRKAKDLDAERLSDIAKKNLKEGFSERSFRSSINNKNAIVLVAQIDNEIVGFLVSYFDDYGEAELLQIAVDENQRKNHIGKTLFLNLVNDLKESKVSKLFLEVRESNVTAISFYRYLGFVEIGVRKGFYENPKEDAKILRLDIDNA